MWSDIFIVNKKFVRELCIEIKKLNIKWVFNFRVDILDYEIVKIMKDSGCWLFIFGIEIYNDKIFEKISKGYKEVDIDKGVNVVKDVGILIVGYYIFGFFGESVEDMKRIYIKFKEFGFDYF